MSKSISTTYGRHLTCQVTFLANEQWKPPVHHHVYQNGHICASILGVPSLLHSARGSRGQSVVRSCARRKADSPGNDWSPGTCAPFALDIDRPQRIIINQPEHRAQGWAGKARRPRWPGREARAGAGGNKNARLGAGWLEWFTDTAVLNAVAVCITMQSMLASAKEKTL